MRLITADEVKEIDKKASEELGLSELVLMENAGIRSFDYIAKKYCHNKDNMKTTILVGKGNNGGDGLVLARHLFNNGYDVRIFTLYSVDDFSPSAKVNWEIVSKMGIYHHGMENERDLNILRIALLSSTVIVDAIYGSGFKGAFQEGLISNVMELIADIDKPIIALDIPSGLGSTNGLVADNAIKATETLTFGYIKVGMILDPGCENCGDIQVLDISLPDNIISEEDGKYYYIDKKWTLGKLPKREKNTHKGNYGHILVMGGSKGMAGAPMIAGNAALKSGAGLVTYMVPESLHQAVMSHNIEALTMPLPETKEGGISEYALETILKNTGNKIMVMGMGMSRNDDTMNIVKSLISKINCPLVIDADALLGLGDLDGREEAGQSPLILTPHPGEMAKILGTTIRKVQDDRVGSALAAATKWKAIVLLKGYHTVIATPDGKVYINSTGNPGMATGGMGDALSGIIGSFLGQGLSDIDATCLGAYYHGLAGDLASEKVGYMGLTPKTLIRNLPYVLKEYEDNQK